MAEETNRFDVPHLECHFKWFKELNILSNGKWLSGLLNRKLHNDLRSSIGPEVDKEELDEDDTVDDPKNPNETDEQETMILRSHTLKELSWRFTELLRDTFEGQFEKAFDRSDKLLNLEEAKNPCQPQAHIDTFTYVVLANQLNILEKWRCSTECPMDANVIDEIIKQMKPLRTNAETNEGKAFISGMKCYLSRDMYDAKSSVDFAKEASELNPQYAGWHESLYKSLRERRRLTDFRQSPSPQEIHACKKAYQLESAGDANKISMSNAVTMSQLNVELLFTCSRGSREHKEISDEAIKFARVAVRLKPNAKRFKIRLAHLLSGRNIYRRFRTEGFAEAQKLIEECEVGECTSEICHKIGKFYCNQQHEGCDTAKGLEWFKKGLKAHAGNFPCLMDMLGNAHFQRKNESEIIMTIDTMLSSQNKESYKCQLMFVKGFFLYMGDKEATLDLWLMAMEEAADLDINFVRLATGNVCFVKGRNRSQALSMMENVKVLMNRRDQTNDGYFGKLMGVVNSVIANFERQLLPARYSHMDRDHGQHNKNDIDGSHF